MHFYGEHVPPPLLMSSFLEAVFHDNGTLIAMAGWVGGMLSYHQDVRYGLKEWGVVSQLFSIICLIILLVFVVTQGEWWNLLVVPPLTWLHIQFTKRWSAKPGSWW